MPLQCGRQMTVLLDIDDGSDCMIKASLAQEEDSGEGTEETGSLHRQSPVSCFGRMPRPISEPQAKPHCQSKCSELHIKARLRKRKAE